MTTGTIKYLGALQMECTHSVNGSRIKIEPAPENGGKNEAFSPTDLLCASMATCAMSIVAVYAERHGLDMTGLTAEVTKVRNPDPKAHRLSAIEVVFNMPPQIYSDKQKVSMERALESCTVKHSIHPDIKQSITFKWP